MKNADYRQTLKRLLIKKTFLRTAFALTPALLLSFSTLAPLTSKAQSPGASESMPQDCSHCACGCGTQQPGMAGTEPMPGTAGGYPAATTTAQEEVLTHPLKDEVLGLNPEIGTIIYEDLNGDTTARGALGLNVDFNLSPLITPNARNVFWGFQTGGFYSHMGSTTANFFGTNPDEIVNGQGANILIVPANLKVGFMLGDSFRLSAHGGANMTYRTVANSVDFGPATSNSTSSVWRWYPNAGLDLELKLNPYVSLIARPDLTFTPGNELFLGSLGFVASIG